MALTSQFQTIFYDVDVNNDSVIDENDLRLYARNQNLDENKFSQKWLRLFDEDKDGVIHEDDFRRRLGMTPRKRAVLDDEEEEEAISVTHVRVQESGRPRKVKKEDESESEKEEGGIVIVREGQEDTFIVRKCAMKERLARKLTHHVLRHHNGKIQPNMQVWKLEEELNEKYQPDWHVRVNPSDKDVQNIKYDEDGLLWLDFTEAETTLFIWRTNPQTRASFWCCC